MLTLGGPGDEIVTEEETEAGRRLPGVGAACPISVQVCNQVTGRATVEMETKPDGSFDVAKNALEEIGVRLAWIMHVKSSLLHGVGNVRMCEHQVLKGAGDASVIGGIGHWFAGGGELGAGVEWRAIRVAVCHACAGKYVLSVLTLREEEAEAGTLYGDAEEEVQVVEVLKGEFAVKRVDHLAK